MPLNIVNSEEIFTRGINFHTLGRYPQAEQCYKQVIQMSPNHPGAHQNLGVLAFQVGRNDAAVPLLRRAIELSPNNAAMYCNLGDVYAALRQGDEAIAAYKKATEIDPKMATVYNNLGIVYSRLGRVEDAINSWKTAIELSARPISGGRVLVGSGGASDPTMKEEVLLAAAAYNNLGNAHLQQIQLDQALACHKKAIELNPNYANAHSNFLRDMTHIPGIPHDQLLREHRLWWQLHTKGIKHLPHKNVPDPNKKLRVGIISADLREHSVTHFMTGFFEKHDRNQIEICCYSGVNRPDEFTQRLGACTKIWRNALGLQDEGLAAAIQEDQVDILFELSGHTSDTRIRVMGFHAAPVQVSYLGYPMTSGAPCIEWHIVDSISDPAGYESHYSEKLYRLPKSAWNYRPPVNIPAQELPAVVRDPTRPFTFGSFNNCSKMSEITFRIWAGALKAAPGSRMMIKASAMNDARTREIVMAGFAKYGVGPERLMLVPQQLELARHFGAYGDIDLALDTYSYHGTTTTCEAFWMNVPVLTMTGDMHISRVGTSLVTNLGHPELAANSEEEFIAKASGYAKHVDSLVALRKGLRERFRTSPIMDDAGFARDMTTALRTMWVDWCAGQKAGG